MVMNTASRVRAAFAVPDVAARQASVAAAMRALPDADIRDDDRRYLLDMCLWRYTEFDKSRYKFSTQYRTAAVLAPTPVEINHEHVVERRWLLDRITAQPDAFETYLKLAVACVVTREEHARLTGSVGFGWERYQLAGIDVVDTSTMRPLDLSAAVAEQRRLLVRTRRTTATFTASAAPWDGHPAAL